MKVLRLTVLLLLFYTYSCSNIDFVYDNNVNLTNPIYNKVSYNFSGDSASNVYQYGSRYLGFSDNPEYLLTININETKTKKSVQSNQAIEKLDYEISYEYNLKKYDSDCEVYNDVILSRFSYVPKSSGYNFGSDQSLEKMYGLVAKKNLTIFIEEVSKIDLDYCRNED